jgi:hypothetical protein
MASRFHDSPYSAVIFSGLEMYADVDPNRRMMKAGSGDNGAQKRAPALYCAVERHGILEMSQKIRATYFLFSFLVTLSLFVQACSEGDRDADSGTTIPPKSGPPVDAATVIMADAAAPMVVAPARWDDVGIGLTNGGRYSLETQNNDASSGATDGGLAVDALAQATIPASLRRLFKAPAVVRKNASAEEAARLAKIAVGDVYLVRSYETDSKPTFFIPLRNDNSFAVCGITARM